MTNQLTFADIQVGQWFHMDFAGQSEVLCYKKSIDEITVTKPNGGTMNMPGKPMWEVKSLEQVAERLRFKQQKQYMEQNPVRGHSNTYPYGEH